MGNQKKYRLQIDIDVEVEDNDGDTFTIYNDENRAEAAKELMEFLFNNEKLIKEHVLEILTEELGHLTKEGKEPYNLDILPIVKEGISAEAQEKLNFNTGAMDQLLFEELYEMVNITASINSETFDRID